MPSSEEWRAVVGWEGLYEVSSHGRVRSVRRDRIMKPDPTKDGHLRVTLSNSGTKTRYMVHRLQAEAFIGPSNGLPVVRHLNDVPWDNRPCNLAWGTFADNTQDAVRNKTHRNAKKVECPQGHPYDEANTILFRGYQRRCLVCSRRWSREAHQRRVEKRSNVTA